MNCNYVFWNHLKKMGSLKNSCYESFHNSNPNQNKNKAPFFQKKFVPPNPQLKNPNAKVTFSDMMIFYIKFTHLFFSVTDYSTP